MVFVPLDGYGDLDEAPVYTAFESAFQKIDTLNFAIEFDTDRAYAALNLDSSSLKRLLDTKRPKASVARWINIFGPERQTQCIEEISRKYELSPRLQGIICSKPSTPQQADASLSNRRMSKQQGNREAHKAANGTIVAADIKDLEKDSQDRATPEYTKGLDLSHYRMVDEVWHYCSTDWSAKSLCVGYNSLSDMSAKTPEEISEKEERKKGKQREKGSRGEDRDMLSESFQLKPGGKRVWTWLILCDDDTVISIHENPYPNHRDDLDQGKAKALKHIRRNLFNVFRQLSATQRDWRQTNPIDTLDIRPSESLFKGATVTISDSPGLLFYYLFDDWYTTYALVAREEQQYARVLDGLRDQMFEKALLSRVRQLHQTGRQLAVLKRMYQSYALIIERILDRQTPRGLSASTIKFHGSDQSAQMQQKSNGPVDSTDEPGLNGTIDQTFGAPLTAKATVKFERLRDRINLYALSEIQECLDEKESLVFLNFNLITMRQSAAVEKLTRITILLAKVTILFMPVSLMTGYFSVQIPDLQNIYSAKTYWVCFAVIMALSFVFLVGFGVISHTLEGRLIYESITDFALTLPTMIYYRVRGRKDDR